MKYIASCSFGKDSLAMVLYLIENNMPLDEVIFYDTGMEFQAIYAIRDKLLPILEKKGIKYTQLKPGRPFLHFMFNEPHKGKQDGIVRYGYGWCGGMCRWGTHEKLETLGKYEMAQEAKVYVGIAADEEDRLRKENKPFVLHPLATAKMNESDCLKYCRDRGWDWIEPTPATESGFIDLYDILDRVSCWCCSNKNLKELYNIYRYLPNYWEKLKELQAQLDRPMKKYACRQYGEYGDVFRMEEIFKTEEANPTAFYYRHLAKEAKI